MRRDGARAAGSRRALALLFATGLILVAGSGSRSGADRNRALRDFQIGRRYLKSKNIEAAVAAFESAIEADPSHAYSHLALGTSHARANNFLAAATSFHHVTLMQPTNYHAQHNLATALTDAGQRQHWPRAVHAYRSSMALRLNALLHSRRTGTCTGFAVASRWNLDPPHVVEVRYVEGDEDDARSGKRTHDGRAPMVLKAYDVASPSQPLALRRVELAAAPAKSLLLVTLQNVSLLLKSGILWSDQACTVYAGAHGHLQSVPLYGFMDHPVAESVAESYLTIATGSLTNYYHWIAEGIGHLLLLLRHTDNILQHTLLLPDTAIARQTWEQIGMHLEPNLDALPRVKWFDATGPGKVWHFNTLTVSDWQPRRQLAPHSQEHGVVHSSWDIHELSMPPTSIYWASPRLLRRVFTISKRWCQEAEEVGTGAAAETVALFLERQGARSRVVDDLEKVWGELVELFASYDLRLERMNGAHLTLCEQVSRIRRSRLLLAVHGAALANLMFATQVPRPPAIVMQLAGEREIGGYFMHLANVLGVPYYTLASVAHRTANVSLFDKLSELRAAVDAAMRPYCEREPATFRLPMLATWGR